MSRDPKLRVFILGQFVVAGADYKMKEPPTLKTRELLTYLLLNRSIHSREKLASLFWPEHGTGQSRKLLSHIIWQLKTAVCKLEPREEYIVADANFVGVSPEAEIWLDAGELEAVFTQSQDVNGRDLAPTQFEALCAAVSLYKGELLPGCYADWCVYERERLLRLYLLLLDKLLTYCEANKLYEQGFRHGETILRHDRARERTHLQLMRMQHHAGYRTMAIDQYRKCRQILADELGVEPARQTQMLYRKICRDRVDEQSTEQLQSPAQENDMTTSFTRIKETLVALQRQMDNLMQIME